jgi:hypothetical protein
MGCKGSTQPGEPGKKSGIEAGSHIKKADDITDFPIFPKDCKSVLSKYLTKGMWNKYKDQKDAQGVSFKNCIVSGVQNVDSGIGAYAGSHDSYRKFSDLFDKVIEHYHKHKKGDLHKSDMDSANLNAPDFSEADALMIKSTRIRVGRNLDGYPLAPGISDDQRKEVEAKVVEAVNAFEGDLKGTYFPLNNMTDEDKNQLIADHFLFKEGDRFLEACGCNNDWPNGRGIFHNDEKTFLVWVNEEDQLRIISMQ